MGIYIKGIPKSNGAGSAKEIHRNGFSSGDGLYWIRNATNGKVFKAYCDMTTTDEFGNSGWMLVASWSNGSQWTLNSTSSASIFDTTPLNCFSSNFGDFYINEFRVTATSSASNLGTNASGGDWYYYWSTPIQWKKVWAYASGTNKNYMNDSSGDTVANITTFAGPAPVNNTASLPRVCMRLFDYAYNIKYNYKASTQRWNNFSDSGGGGQQTWYDYWTGLNTPGYTLGVYNLGSDGTLGIIPSGDTSTTAAHDCNNNQSKVGYDDGIQTGWYGTSATANLNTQGGISTDYPLFFWIR